MKKATKQKATKPEADLPAACETPIVGLIDLDRITPSEYNPRRRFDPGTLAELAQSLKVHGMLHPVVCRPDRMDDLAGSRYELLAGRRRYEAAKLAGLVQIPVSIVSCDDDAAMDICVTENLQREQLNAVEEARGVRMLLDSGRSLDEIADSLGKSISWVRRRNTIADLIPEIATEVERGTRPEDTEDCEPYEVTGWWQAPVAVLEYVGRLPSDVQQKVRFSEADDIDTLRDYVNDLLLEIRRAPWNEGADDEKRALNTCEALCHRCGRRTDVQSVLFEDMAESARCLDRDCWDQQEKKWRDMLRARAAKAAGIRPDQVPCAASMNDPLYWRESEPAEQGDRGAKPMLVGNRIEWRKEIRKDSSEENCPTVPRENRVWKAFARIVGKIASEDNGEALTHDEALAYAAASTGGLVPNKPDFWEAYQAHLAAQGGRKPTAAKALWKQARLRVPSVLAIWNASHIDKDVQDGVEKMIEFLHLDREALWADAETEVDEKEGV